MTGIINCDTVLCSIRYQQKLVHKLMDHPAVGQIRILLPPCNRSVCLWWIARRFLLVLILLVSPHLFIASTIRPIIKPGAAGNRFGYYVSVDCAMFQSAQVIQVHKNSPDLLFKSPSLLIYRGKGSARTPERERPQKGEDHSETWEKTAIKYNSWPNPKGRSVLFFHYAKRIVTELR